MNTRINTMAVTLLTFAVLSGCAQTSGHWDRKFGDSVRTTVASQVADPSAARNANPVHGMDGRAAAAAQKGYESSFLQPTAQKSIIAGQGQ